MKWFSSIALVTLGAVVLTACQNGLTPEPEADLESAPDIAVSGDPSASPSTTLSVTTTILGSVVEQMVECVGDESIAVEVLMPIGVDPHDYQPSSAQLATIAESGIVVANGLMLEESLIEPLEELESEGGVVYRMGEMADPLAFSEIAVEGDDHDHDHTEEAETDEGHDGHDHGEFDPHFWLDMERVAVATETLGEGLSDLDPAFVDCAADVASSIREAEAEMVGTLDEIPEDNRVLVTDHEVMNYFAQRYDFEVAGVLIRGGSTLAEPSSQELAELVEQIQSRGLTTLFGNYHVPSDLLDAIAEESGGGVQVVPLYLGSIGEPGSGYASYQEMMLSNARVMAQALGS